MLNVVLARSSLSCLNVVNCCPRSCLLILAGLEELTPFFVVLRFPLWTFVYFLVLVIFGRPLYPAIHNSFCFLISWARRSWFSLLARRIAVVVLQTYVCPFCWVALPNSRVSTGMDIRTFAIKRQMALNSHLYVIPFFFFVISGCSMLGLSKI